MTPTIMMQMGEEPDHRPQQNENADVGSDNSGSNENGDEGSGNDHNAHTTKTVSYCRGHCK